MARDCPQDLGYRYPDPNDLITARMIATISSPQVWAREEEQVLNALCDEVASLPPPRSLLDFGAGEGRLTSRMEHLFARADLIEPDAQRRLAIASRLTPNDTAAVVRAFPDLYQCGNQGAYDVILISHVIQHVSADRVRQVLADAGARCRSGGIVYVATALARHDDEYRLASVSPLGSWEERVVGSEEFSEHAASDFGEVLPIHFFPLVELRHLLERSHVRPVWTRPFHEVLASEGTSVFRDVAVIGRKE
jgi:SAM-dependent methyltransferase